MIEAIFHVNIHLTEIFKRKEIIFAIEATKNVMALNNENENKIIFD